MWGDYPYPYIGDNPGHFRKLPLIKKGGILICEVPALLLTMQSKLKMERSVHVTDFIIDDETWAIRYLIVDTGNWWPGKIVLVSPRWIKRISWSESNVYVDLSRATIKQSPAYHAGTPLNREYEEELHRHYNFQGYWIDEPVINKDSHLGK